jgi:transposase
MLHVGLVKNGTLLVLLNAINAVKDGCFRAAFMEILKGLVSFGRKNRVPSTLQDIERRSSLLLRVTT